MKFTQYDIEGELSDAVPNGIKNDIARVTGIYPSVVTGWFNRDDERKSPQYQMLQIQAALDNLYPEIGEAHWNTLERLREANKPARREGLCVHSETAKSCKEHSEFTSAVLSDAPLYDQLKEALENRDQAERAVRALLEKIHEDTEAEGQPRARFNGKPVSFETRNKVRDLRRA